MNKRNPDINKLLFIWPLNMKLIVFILVVSKESANPEGFCFPNDSFFYIFVHFIVALLGVRDQSIG